ncbi:uncharacterized protein LOC129224807 [Uloborus diversus]|uniref:uncharacterized protein LOC129224807 n=1 Tax=Uloborus diversus TaxID=327109 RepID=UPI00240A5FE0|nr:uncharacterized protein LOC129224807 [Uloborus diversus]
MARRTVGEKFLTHDEIMQIMHSISSDDSGSDAINSDFESDDCILDTEENSFHAIESDENKSYQSSSENSTEPEEVCLPVPGRKKFRGRGTRTEQNINNLDENASKDEVAKNGTVWKSLDQTTPGRLPSQNILKEKCGPTSFAERNADHDSATSVWRLFINEKMLKHIQQCTEAESARCKNDNWKVTLAELDAFISLLYVRGAMLAKGLSIDALCVQMKFDKGFGVRFNGDL